MEPAHVSEPPADLRERISVLLSSLTTVSLATVNQKGEPCAAAVYYAHDENLALYFLSSKTTVHGANLLVNPRVAGTVFADRQEWKSLCGIQLTGQAAPVQLLDYPHAADVFMKKYPFVSLVTSGSPAELLKAMSTTVLWRLRPDWIRMTDNSRGFGFKEELILGTDGKEK